MITFETEDFQAETNGMYHLVKALEVAVNMDFMAREHGAAIWKNYLKNTGFDVPKKAPLGVGQKEEIC